MSKSSSESPQASVLSRRSLLAAAALSQLPYSVSAQESATSDFFTDIDSALKKSIIPRDDIDRIWTRSEFVAAGGGTNNIAAARVLLARLPFSHVGIYNADDTEFYDLAAIGFFQGRPSAEASRVYGADGPSYPGIGAWFRSDPNRAHWAVSQVFSGGVAASQGLRPGDVIISADGKTFTPVGAFRVATGREVELILERDGARRAIKVRPEVVRPFDYYADLTQKSVTKLPLGDGRTAGYVRAYSFYRPDDLDRLRGWLGGELADCAALILDLRGAWGATPLDFCEPFVGGVPAMTLTTASGKKIVSSWNWCRPLVVVVDQTTRSGKELFAAALGANGIPVVGRRSAGQVLSMRPMLVGGGQALLELPFLDVELNGERLEGRGVTPTVAVNSSADADFVLAAKRAAISELKMSKSTRRVCTSSARS